MFLKYDFKTICKDADLMRQFLRECRNNIEDFKFTTCCKVLESYFFKLKNMENTKCTYKLIKGSVFNHKGVTYSNANLTDKVAKEWLSENKNRKTAFEIIPEKPQPKKTVKKEKASE